MNIGDVLVFFIITFPHLLPQYIEDLLDSVPLLSITVTMISIFGIMWFFLRNYRRVFMGTVDDWLLLILFVAQYVVLLISTAKNGGNLFSAFLHAVIVLLLCLVVSLASEDEETYTALLIVVQKVSLFYCLLNIYVTIAMPNGIPSITENAMFPKFLYGNVNSTIRGIFPGLCCSILLDKKNKKHFGLSTFLYFASVIFICVRVYVMATAIICMVFLLAWNMFDKFIRKNLRFVYICLLVVILSFEIIVVLQASGSGLTAYVTQLFGKSLDFSGRRALWTNALFRIAQKPIWGYGLVNQDEMYFLVGNKFSAHNYYLDIAVQRGIIGLIVSCVIWVLPVFLIKKTDGMNQISCSLLGMCGAVLFMFLSEPFYSSEFRFIPIFYITYLLLGRSSNGAVHFLGDKSDIKSNAIGGKYE